MAGEERTLQELCAVLGISRRAVQGYEKYGLVRSTGRTKRGYLLYDTESQERIVRIRCLQEYGFPLKEVAALLSASPEEQRLRLLEKRVLLLKRQEQLEEILARLDGELEAL